MKRPTTNFAHVHLANREKWKKTLIELGEKTTSQRVLREQRLKKEPEATQKKEG